MTALVVFFTLLTVSIFGAEAGTDWSYDGLNGPAPDGWAEDYPDCGGSSQSPINIDTGSVVSDPSLGSLFFDGWTTPPPQMTLLNTGHSAEVKCETDAFLSGGGLPGTYKVTQFHFHWGSDSSQGSENTVDDFRFPMEMHIVMYNTDYSDFSSASTEPEGLAVLSVLFVVEGESDESEESEESEESDGSDLNQVFEDIADNLQNIQNNGDTFDLTPFSLNNILPRNTCQFYRYAGSLTTPGCYESVVWTVLTDPIVIQDSMLEKFRALSNPIGDPLENNFRPTQDLNGREVTANFSPDVEVLVAVWSRR